MIAATYSRVSDPNDRREASLESQEEAQVKLLESRGYTVPEEYRFREKFTGMESIYDRPVLGRVRDLIAAGTVTAMASYDTDRLARDPRHLLTVVADNQRHGAETLFVKCDHDTSGRIGEMLLYMKGFASALEWDAIQDRTTRGRQKVLQKGQWIGGGTTKYGYLWDKETRARSANPETAPVVVRIFEEIAAGMSLQELAAALNREGVPTPYAYAGRAGADATWWPTCIRRLVRDRTYLGEARIRQFEDAGTGRGPNGRPRRRPRPDSEHIVLSDGRTDALVTADLFRRANRAMASANSRRGRPGKATSHLLAGAIHCGACGSRMTPASFMDRRGASPRRILQYRCLGHRHKDGPRCGRIVGAAWVEETAWRQIAEKVLMPGFLERQAAALIADDGADRLRADLAAAGSRRAKIGKDVKKLIDAQLENAGSRLLSEALADKLATLDAQAEDLDAHIEDLTARIAEAGGRGAIVGAFMARIADLRDRARRDEATAAQKREAVEVLAAKVVAWIEGGERCLNVELPFDARPAGRRVKMEPTMCRTSPCDPAQQDHNIIILKSTEAA